MKLNLGCGNNKILGYVNIDQEQKCNPDEVWNLEATPWRVWDKTHGFARPILRESVTEICAHHVLEHIGRTPNTFCDIMKEIYRVLQPAGTIEIKVPHPRGDNFLGDPTHVRAVTPGVLSLFSKKECLRFAENNWPNTPLATYLDIDLEIRSVNFALTQYWGEKHNAGTISKEELDFAMNAYNNVVDEITIVMFKAS